MSEAPAAVAPEVDPATLPAIEPAPEPTGGTVPPAKTETLVEKDDNTRIVPADWPADWRERMAEGAVGKKDGEDYDKVLARLNRFTAPQNITKSWWNQLGVISKAPKPKPETDDPEQLNAWRAERGIPVEPDGYFENIPGGIVIGDEDKELAGTFAKSMHEIDAPPEFVHKALAWHQQLKEQQAAQLQQEDTKFRVESEDALRAEWGPEYRPHLNGIHALIDTYGTPDVKTKFFAARTAEGRPLGDDPDVLRFLAGVSREINPHGAVTLTEGQNMSTAISEEKAQLEKEMADTKGRQYDYWRNPAKQDRYRTLLEIEEKAQRRGR